MTHPRSHPRPLAHPRSISRATQRQHLAMIALPTQAQCSLLMGCNHTLPARPFQRLYRSSRVSSTEQRLVHRCPSGLQSSTSLSSRIKQNQQATSRVARKTRCCKAVHNSEGKEANWEPPVQAIVLAGLVLLSFGYAAECQAATQQSHGSEVFQLASEDSEFWVNVSRYGRYFITVLLGTAYISVKPVLELLKRPKTAFLVLTGIAVLYLFVSTTVQAMLGVSNPLDYQPSSFFPENY